MTNTNTERDRTYDDHADLDITGTVQRIFRGPKATRVALKCEDSPRITLLDVISFRKVDKVQQGDRVHVVGRIGSEKIGKEISKSNGREYDKWAPMLVAERIELLSEVQERIPGTGKRHEPANDNAYSDREIDDIPF